MTYRERRLAKAERLRGWAEKREKRAGALRAQTPDSLRHDHAFLTQPGRIPERERMHDRDQRAYEIAEKGREMAARAEQIEAQADRAIYSDDPDACEQLKQRIADLEAERDRIKRYNATARKGAPDFSILTEPEQRSLLSAARAGQADEQPVFPAYHLRNLGGNINRQKKRLAKLRAPRWPRSITARRDGRCGACDEPIRAGVMTITEIEAGVWVHAGCAGRYAVRCDDCKRDMRRTDSLAESAAGGRCVHCRGG